MLPWLDLVPRWVLLAGAVAAAAALAAQTVRLASARAELTGVQLVLAQERQAAAEAGRLAAERFRAAEQRLQAVGQEITNDTIARTAVVQRALPRAAAAGDGLRLRAAAVAARCDRAAEGAAPATDSPAAAHAGAVLADVLGRLDQAGRELAEIADQRGIAGADCQRRHEALDARPAE